MKLSKITLSGFRSFKDRHDLVFDRGSVFVLGTNHDDPAFDSNGGGKTTLCAAVPWALYGALSTDAKKDAIINRDSEKAFVELRFEDKLHVRRSKERNRSESLSFWHEGRWHDGDLAATQEKLTKVIGVSAALFFNSLWIDAQSKAVQFLWATAGKRLELLEELMSDGIYASARSKAEEKRKQWETKQAFAKDKITAFMHAEERERQTLARAQAELAQASFERKARLQKQGQRQVELRLELGRLQAQLDEFTGTDTPDALTAQRQRLEWDLHKLSQQISDIPLPPRLPHAGTTCPSCLQDVSEDHVHSVQARSEAKLKEREVLQAKADRIREEVAEVNQKIKDYSSTTSVRRSVETVIRDRKRELSALAEASTEDPFVLSLEQTIESAKDAIVGIQKNLQQHEQILHEAHRQIPLYKFWETGFGQKGIRSLLLDDVRALLAYHVDLYTKSLAGEQIRVEFPASDKGFEIILHTPAGTAELNTFSRGEAWRANLSVLLALRKTISYLNATNLSLLILDDPCGDLDDSGVRAVVSTVQALSSEFGTVMVTLPRHVDNIGEDDIIRVEKRQGVSTFVTAEEV